jgi:hypothetical protein
MSRKLLLVVTTSVGLLLALWLASSAAQAQETPPTPGPDDANCLRCHEDLYYLYDTGKWHCLCEASPSCLHCHGGQPGTLDEEQAHAGMIANPLQANAAVCQQCHGDDSQERVEQFIAVAGGTVTGGRGRVYPTAGPAPTSPPPGRSAYRLPERLREPWRLAAVGVAVVAIAALCGYALYLYRTEQHKPLAL